VDPIVSPVEIDLCHRRYDQRQFLDQGLAGIQPKGLLLGQRQLLEAEITVEDKPVADGELVVIRKKLLEDDEPEIFGDIVFP
jgi:hypothetical protein